MVHRGEVVTMSILLTKYLKGPPAQPTELKCPHCDDVNVINTEPSYAGGWMHWYALCLLQVVRISSDHIIDPRHSLTCDTHFADREENEYGIFPSTPASCCGPSVKKSLRNIDFCLTLVRYDD